jgi:hypothetical protein
MTDQLSQQAIWNGCLLSHLGNMDLLETSRLMREQNNRGTQYPLFIIQQEVETITGDGRGDKTIYWNGNDQTSIKAETYEALENAQDNEVSDDEIEELLSEAGLEWLADFNTNDWERLEVKNEFVFADNAGFFFTEKACHDHIESNNYHYNKPRSYVISAWRNPEIVATMQMILKLTGDNIPNQYK